MSNASKGAKEIKPFDQLNTNDAKSKTIDELMKMFEAEEIKRRRRDQFFNNPQSPRA